LGKKTIIKKRWGGSPKAIIELEQRWPIMEFAVFCSVQ
jgi:hypothetical protein